VALFGIHAMKLRPSGKDQKELPVFVSASTECFRDLPLSTVFDRLVDLEYSSVEVALHEDLDHLKPSAVLADMEGAIEQCRQTNRLDIVAFSFLSPATGEEYYAQFDACCRLAKATKVVTLVIDSAELGTPFNEEVERLRKLVALAEAQGARVGMRSQVGRLTEDPDTAVVLCDNVEGLGMTLDPSHYIANPRGQVNYDKLFKYTYHTHLRDTSKDEVQVKIGKGIVDYSRLVNMLIQAKYDRSLCVHLEELPDVDHFGEMRKMRLLLESLL
jgi:sugar phosphate isomerase/epimerase